MEHVDGRLPGVKGVDLYWQRQAVGTDDLTVRRYDGLWHEIYHEPERAQPLGDLREWLSARR
ncbi:MAG TPA: hypothetical protein VFY38_08595 [Pseudonocardia sp.]|nr:hypothetical protein [Pseudonocardia sp.]